MKKRVLISSSRFDLSGGYHEAILGSELIRQGYDVFVICRDDLGCSESDENITVYQVKCKTVGKTSFPLQKLDRIVKEIKPEIAFFSALNLGLPYYVMKHLPKECKVVSIHEDLESQPEKGYYRESNPIKKYLLKKWYKKLFCRADLIVMASSGTEKILRQRYNMECDALYYPFCYDQNKFYSLPNVEKKDSLRLSTVTLIHHLKPVAKWLASLKKFITNHDCEYVIAGFKEDAYGKSVNYEISQLKIADKITTNGLLNAAEINELYNKSDYVIWYQASIGIQQALGAGARVVIPRDQATEGLDKYVSEGSIIYYNDHKDLSEILERAHMSIDDKTNIESHELSIETWLKVILNRIKE